ncbi:MAG: Hypothetical protein AJITA_00187 [Acetilactobacillus jinshanensis]
MMRKLVELKRHNKIIVIVDHDLTGYRKIADQLLIMNKGRLQAANFSQLMIIINQFILC